MSLFRYYVQKQLCQGVLMRNCSENMPQIYKRTPKQKCGFNRVAFYLHGNDTLA